MSSPRLSSRNKSPNSFLFEEPFSFLWLDFVLGCVDIGLLLLPLLPLLLFEKAGIYPHRGGNGFLMHAWKSSSFQRCSNLVSLARIFHGRLWRFETQIIEVLFLLAQWWTVIHIPRLVKFKQNTLKHSMIVLLLMIVPIWALNPASSISSRSSCTAPSSGLDNFHTWDCSFEHSLNVLVLMSTLEIALVNILRDVLVLLDVADVHQCNKVDFPYLLFCVFSLWPPFISFPLSP